MQRHDGRAQIVNQLKGLRKNNAIKGVRKNFRRRNKISLNCRAGALVEINYVAVSNAITAESPRVCVVADLHNMSADVCRVFLQETLDIVPVNRESTIEPPF